VPSGQLCSGFDQRRRLRVRRSPGQAVHGMQGVGQSAGIGRLMMPRDLIARAKRELVNKMIKRPLAWIPVAMSVAILAMVLTTIGLSGAVRQEDVGTQAHSFQIWLVLEVVVVAEFANPIRRRLQGSEVAKSRGGASAPASSGVPVTRNIRTACAGDQPVEVMDTISHGEVVMHRFELKL
jgi:hypothetical protein